MYKVCLCYFYSIFRTNITITLNVGGAARYAYTCFVFTSVNAYSYYYYQNTRKCLYNRSRPFKMFYTNITIISQHLYVI